MLTLIPQTPPTDRLTEARELLRFAELGRMSLWVLCELLFLPLLAVCLLAAGHNWGCTFLGAALALGLSRYGPSWWPGRR